MMSNKQKFVKPAIEEGQPTEEMKNAMEAKVTEAQVEAKPVEPVKVEEPKKEEVKTEAPVEKPVVKKEEVKAPTPTKPVTEVKTPVVEIKVGQAVKIKTETKLTVTGQVIPAFAFKNTYKVVKVLPNRIIIGVGTLQYAVKETDLVKA